MSGGIRVDLNRADAETDPELLDRELENCYAYHPWTDEQKAAGEVIRKALADAARNIILLVPPCPDRSTALRKLREARMDANSAITHRGQY